MEQGKEVALIVRHDMNWDVDNQPFADFSWAAYDWIKNNPL